MKKFSTNSWVLLTILSINTLVTIILVIFAALSNSLSLLSDVFHMIVDNFTYLGNFCAQRERDQKSHMASNIDLTLSEIFASLFSGLSLLISTTIISYEAIIRLRSSSVSGRIDDKIMLWSSAGNMCFQLISLLAFRYLDIPHYRSHGQDDPSCESKLIVEDPEEPRITLTEDLTKNLITKKSESLTGSLQDNLNIFSVFIHVLCDYIKSVIVFITALIIRFSHVNRVAFDSIVSIIVSVNIFLLSAWLLVQSLRKLGQYMKSYPNKNEINGEKSLKIPNDIESGDESEDPLLTMYEQ